MRIAPSAKPVAQLKRGSSAAVAAFLACGLIGCAQIREATAINPPPINPSSPIADYANQVSHQTFATPNFHQVPPKPTDVRTPAAYKLAVIREVQMRRDLAAWRETHPALTSDTDAWADLQRHRIPTTANTPVSAAHDAESEAFAKRLREEAAKPQPQQ